MAEERGLSVRQAKRHDLALDADLWIAPEDAARVRFSGAAGARDDRIRVTIVDASAGGLGIVSPVFIPRRCAVVVRAHDPHDATRPPVIQVRLLVQRTRMTDRRPAYLLGTAFSPADGAESEAVVRLMKALDSDERAPGVAGERGRPRGA